jgi:hypothetical protein
MIFPERVIIGKNIDDCTLEGAEKNRNPLGFAYRSIVVVHILKL